MIKFLEDSGILLKSVSEAIENERKETIRLFLWHFVG